MASLNDLATVSITLNTTAFQDSTFSTMAVVYNATGSDTTPHLVTSQASALTASSMLATDWAYGALGAAFAQNPGPTQVMLLPRASGQNTATALTTQLPNADPLGGFYGFVSQPQITVPDQFGAMQWAEANGKLFVTLDVTQQSDTANTSDLCGLAQSNNFNYSAVLATFNTVDEPPNSYADAAWMAAEFAYHPGSENWANTLLNGCVASPFNETQRAYVLGKNGNTYQKYGAQGANAIALTAGGTVGSGERIDVVRFRDFLANDIKTRVATALIRRPKLAYTDAGISAIKAQVVAALDNGILCGGIAPSYVAADGVTLVPSYTVSAPLRSTVAAADVTARVLRGISFTAILAGAINTAAIAGNLGY